MSKNARIKAYAKGLKDLGHNIKIYVGFASSLNKHHINKEATGTWNGLPYEYLSGTSRYSNGKFNKLFTILGFWKNLNLLLNGKNYQADIALVYGSTLFDFHFWLPKLKRRSGHLSVIYTELPSLLNPSSTQHWIENRLAKYADSLLVVSNNLVGKFSPINKQTRLVTPIVVDSSRFSSVHYHASSTIGYLGTFGEKDGVHFMVNGYLKAKESLPNLKLTLMGFIAEEGIEDYLIQLTEQYPDIAYLGALESDAIPSQLAACDTLIMNRINTPYARTGFPIKLAEYLATGIPTLVTNFEEYHPYVPSDWVYYYQPDDLEDFTSKIIERYENEDEAVQRSSRAREQVDNVFGQDKAATELNTIFEELMKTHDAR